MISLRKVDSKINVWNNSQIVAQFATDAKIVANGNNVEIYDEIDKFKFKFTNLNKANCVPIVTATNTQDFIVEAIGSFFPDASTGGGGGDGDVTQEELDTALALYQLLTGKGAENGYAGLDANAFLPEGIFPLDKRIAEQLVAFPVTIDFTRNRTYFTRTTPTALAVPAKTLTGAIEGCWAQIFHQDTDPGAAVPDLGNYPIYGGYVIGLVNRIIYFIAGGEIQIAIDQVNAPLTAVASGIDSEFPQFPYLFQSFGFRPVFTNTAGANLNTIWRKYADAIKTSPVQIQEETYAQRGGSHDFTVDLCSIINQTLSGTPTIDSVSSSARSVLLIAQTNRAENGLYDVSAGGVWTRNTSFDSGTEYNVKTVFVSGGTLEKGKSFQARYYYPSIVWDTTELIFDEITFQRIIEAGDTAYVGFEVQVSNGLGAQANSELATPIIQKTSSNVILGTKTGTNGTITTETSGLGAANDIDVLSSSITTPNTNMSLKFASSIVDEQFHFLNGMLWVEGAVLTANSKVALRIAGANPFEVFANGAKRGDGSGSIEAVIMDNSASRPAIAYPFVQDRWMPIRMIFRKTDIGAAASLSFRLDQTDLTTTTTKMKILLFPQDAVGTPRNIKLIQL